MGPTRREAILASWLQPKSDQLGHRLGNPHSELTTTDCGAHPTSPVGLQPPVSSRVPEIRLPVRNLDSPDFSGFRRLSLDSMDIEDNPTSAVVAGGVMRDWLWCQARG
ncbi:uncharacterized protein MEPE_05667 [Melanopsichium pennsylvanicum]|uniref:Uncharacterized protein n=1 Tax=Melanopsichium pennsylvanicum TaxID=63383 RepID=A0AAJ4XRH5_9BASI|nr:uncharacterized protein MEPE_05667 [Melanopsichium pennsylvanicum]